MFRFPSTLVFYHFLYTLRKKISRFRRANQNAPNKIFTSVVYSRMCFMTEQKTIGIYYLVAINFYSQCPPRPVIAVHNPLHVAVNEALLGRCLRLYPVRTRHCRPLKRTDDSLPILIPTSIPISIPTLIITLHRN